MNVLISCRSHYFKSYKENRDCIDQKLIDWTLKLDLNPIILPNILGKRENRIKLNNFLKKTKASALILSGGENFELNEDRDCLEELILKKIFKEKKPVLGICRGLQMICKYYGSKIVKSDARVRENYKIKVVDGNRVYNLKAKCYFKNTINKIPSNFNLIGSNKLSKKTPWMIAKKNGLCEGWMIHPERENKFSLYLLKRAKKLLNSK